MNIQERLREIDIKLKANGLQPAETAALHIEKIWARSALGEIKPEARIEELDQYLNDLEADKPDVYVCLIKREDGDQNELMRIARKYSID